MGLFDSRQNVSSEVTSYDKQLAVLAKKKDEIIFQIGKMYVENNDSKAVEGTIYEEKIKEIEKIEDDVIILEKRKLAAQGLRKCESCGNVLVLDSLFCNKCGDKLAPVFTATEENPYICSNCGASYEENALFCKSCGNKLK